MLKNKITIGIIGCGHWGPNFIRNFNQLDQGIVKCISELNHEKISHIKNLYPQIRVTTNYKEILTDKDISAVVIATPAVTHYKLVKESLLAGKDVLVEKPIATSIKDAKDLISLARGKKRILMVGHTFMYNPAVNKVKELIKKRVLGKVYYLYSQRTNLGPLRRDINSSWDLAPHDISIFSYWLNADPVGVWAQGQDYLQPGKEDVVFATLNYKNKIMGHIHVSWLDPRKTRAITVVGTKKMLVFDDLNSLEPVRLYDKKVMKKRFKQDYATFEEFKMIIQDGKTIAPQVKMVEPLSIECAHFLDCIRNRKRPLSDGENGLRVLKVLLEIEKSLKKNKGARCR